MLIWRDQVLPPSETFIFNQTAAFQRFSPYFAGLISVPNPWQIAPSYEVMNGRFASLAKAQLTLLGHSPKLRSLVLENGIELIHAHFAYDAMRILAFARRQGLPLVATFHGYDVTTLRPRRRLQQDRWKALFQYADMLVAVSSFVEARLVELGAPAAKIMVHHIGVPIGSPPVPFGSKHGICFVGRLVEKKGAGDLLAAVRRLPEPLSATPVTVIGDGPLRAVLEASAVGLNVSFTGALPPHEVRRHLERNAIFCGPSRTAPSGDSEGFGMVFLEAAEAGLPVVSYSSGGVPSAVSPENGILVPEGDIYGLAEALASLLSDPSRAARLGSAGRARVVNEFNIQRRSAILENLYDDVIHARRMRRDPII